MVERGGRTIKGMLQKSDVCPKNRCWDELCPVCLTNEKGKCNVKNIGYSILCKSCWESGEKNDLSVKERKFIMHGESSKTARVRCSEHRDALQKRTNSNL